MSGSNKRFKWRRRGHGTEQDFELNITSIIDCLTVLIAFVLVTTSFLSVGVLEAQVAANGDPQSEVQSEPVQVGINLTEGQTMVINVTGKLNHTYRLNPKAGKWNYDSLTDHLAMLKGEFPKLNTATLSADDTIPYRELVKSMDIARKAVPGLLLGGF